MMGIKENLFGKGILKRCEGKNNYKWFDRMVHVKKS